MPVTFIPKGNPEVCAILKPLSNFSTTKLAASVEHKISSPSIDII